jgi:hypothetical protein
MKFGYNNITEPNSKYESKMEKQSEWFREFENSSTDTNNNIQFQNIYVDASTQDLKLTSLVLFSASKYDNLSAPWIIKV